MRRSARRVAVVAGAATAALTFGLAVGLHDRDALLLTVGIAIAVGLTLRWRLLGGVVLAVLLADVTGWMGLAFASHLRHDDPFASSVVSALLVISSVTGLAALGVLAFSRRGEPPAPRRQPRPALAAALGLTWGAVAAVVVGLAPSAVSIPAAKPGQLVVGIKNSRFTSDALRSRSGWVTIVVANPDLFWHTFTVPDLHIDITVPVGSVRQAAAKLAPGRYEYVCRVPGHNRMHGVLVVA
jgi:hypothetical protein